MAAEVERPVLGTPDPEALADATLIVQMVERDPLYVASQYARMQEAVKGAYALAAALVARLGGAVTLTPEEFDNRLPLNIVKHADGAVVVSNGSRAVRRKKKPSPL